MRLVNESELSMVCGAGAAQVLGCVGAGVAGGVGYAQGYGSSATATGGLIMIAGNCLAGALGTVPGLGSAAMTVAFFASELASSHTPTAQEAAQGYRDTGTSCAPLPGSGLSMMVGGGSGPGGVPLFLGGC